VASGLRAFAEEAMTEPPFAPDTHPERAEIARRSVAWADRFALTSGARNRERLLRADAAELAARACPDGPTESVGLLADLITWLFAFDDRCDEEELCTDPVRLAPVLAALLDVVDRLGSPPTAGPRVPRPRTGGSGPAEALHDLNRRLRAARHRVPADAPAHRARCCRASWSPTSRWARPAARLRVDPRTIRLDLLAADLACWCNDLFSYAKERGRDGHNLVAVIAAERGYGERRAMVEAAARFNAGLTGSLTLEAELAERADKGLRRMLAVRRHWLRATYDWSMRAQRYA
jgi:hypothetical protein